MGASREDRLKALFTALQALPLVRFALMLGGGMMATGGVTWAYLLLGHGTWPIGEAVALARINAIMLLGMSSMTVIGIVMVALAFGKLTDLNITTPAGSVSLKVDDDDPPPAPAAPTMTMTMSATPAPVQPIGDGA